MMKLKTPAVLLIAAALQSPALAGVVFQVETTYHSGSPRVEHSEMSVEKPNIKMEILPGRGSASNSPKDVAIFNGNRRQMVVVDHRDGSYMQISSAGFRQHRGQPSGQNQEMMKRIEGLDPKQRAILEQMLTGQTERPGARSKSINRATNEFRKSSDRATKQGYPCVRYDVIRGGQKVQELWVTDWNNIAGGSDVSGSIGDLVKFRDELLNSMNGAGGLLGDDLDLIDCSSSAPMSPDRGCELRSVLVSS